MKIFIGLIFGLVIISLMSTPLSAQVKIMAKEGDILEIAELGAIVLQSGEKIEVKFIAPPEMRPKVYRDVDIEQDDFILMANGKPLKHVKDLNKIYQDLKAGDQLKLALQRGEKKFLVSFERANPDDLPQRKQIIMHRSTAGNGEAEESDQSSPKSEKKIIKHK